jgi:hypothetical protein
MSTGRYSMATPRARRASAQAPRAAHGCKVFREDAAKAAEAAGKPVDAVLAERGAAFLQCHLAQSFDLARPIHIADMFDGLGGDGCFRL